LEGIPEKFWNIPPDITVITGTPAVITVKVRFIIGIFDSITAGIGGLLQEPAVILYKLAVITGKPVIIL
jgi:hypothetical protein